MSLLEALAAGFILAAGALAVALIRRDYIRWQRGQEHEARVAATKDYYNPEVIEQAKWAGEDGYADARDFRKSRTLFDTNRRG